MEKLKEKEIETSLKIPLWLANMGLGFTKSFSKKSKVDLEPVSELLKQMKGKTGIFFEVEEHSDNERVTFSIE